MCIRICIVSNIHIFFTESWQLHNFKTKIRETKCNGEDIEVEEILPTRSVIISNITETKRNQKYLEEYFSDPKKSGAHRFDSLELLEDDQVLVHFEDSESMFLQL